MDIENYIQTKKHRTGSVGMSQKHESDLAKILQGGELKMSALFKDGHSVRKLVNEEHIIKTYRNDIEWQNAPQPLLYPKFLQCYFIWNANKRYKIFGIALFLLLLTAIWSAIDSNWPKFAILLSTHANFLFICFSFNF